MSKMLMQIEISTALLGYKLEWWPKAASEPGESSV